MAFLQDPFVLSDPYEHDWLLRGYLQRVLPERFFVEVDESLRLLSKVVKDELEPLVVRDRLAEPVWTPFDPFGHRIDRIDVTRVWEKSREVAVRFGLVGMAFERKYGAWSRVVQAAHLHLFAPSSDVYTCPLAMTDGAARALTEHDRERFSEVIFRLTTRNPALAWTAGQWMTERTGGSDVSRTEAVAKPLGDGTYALYGNKWFTSAITSEVALTLARPEGAGQGSRALAVFLVETRQPDGRPNHLQILRMKDKLGTRKLPTAELELEGAIAVPVAGLTDGVRNIAPVLNVTRLWNAICSIAGMQRALQLAADYAQRRSAFGKTLAELPLHVDTLADWQAELVACFHLVMATAGLAGRADGGEADADELALLRLLLPLCKLYTGKQAVGCASEVVESFGGAGYCEDSGIPRLLRDAQVLAIWEGTTNVLAVDALKTMAHGAAFEILVKYVDRIVKNLDDAHLRSLGRTASAALRDGAEFLRGLGDDRNAVEAEARRMAFTLARAVALALVLEQADSKTVDGAQVRGVDRRLTLAADRFARAGINRLARAPLEESRGLLFG